jgi:hypothetical protein
MNVLIQKDTRMMNIVMALLMMAVSSGISARILAEVPQLPQIPQVQNILPEVSQAPAVATSLPLDIVNPDILGTVVEARCAYCWEHGITCSRDSHGRCIPCQELQKSLQEVAAAALALEQAEAAGKLVTFDTDSAALPCGCGKPKGFRCDSCAEALLKKSLQDALAAALAQAGQDAAAIAAMDVAEHAATALQSVMLAKVVVAVDALNEERAE